MDTTRVVTFEYEEAVTLYAILMRKAYSFDEIDVMHIFKRRLEHAINEGKEQESSPQEYSNGGASWPPCKSGSSSSVP